MRAICKVMFGPEQYCGLPHNYVMKTRCQSMIIMLLQNGEKTQQLLISILLEQMTEMELNLEMMVKYFHLFN